MTDVSTLADLMGNLGDIVKQQSENVNVILGKVGDLAKQFDNLKSDVGSEITEFKAGISKEIKSVKDEFETMKASAEITTEQRRLIKRAVNTQVYKILDLPEHKENLTIEDRVTIRKYSRIFHQRCYAEVSRMGHLGNPYGTTIARNYTQAIRDIEAWTPSNGISGLMKEADDNALARKIAREQGYE